MKTISRACGFILGCLAACAGPYAAAQQASSPFPPLQQGETLRYRLQWPSGLTLGEATLRAIPSGKEVRLELTVEAGLPQYTLRDTFSAVATQEDLCSLQFRQEISEGARQRVETIEFDLSARQATHTRGNQTTTMAVPPCPRDPLTFLYYVRREAAAGRPVTSGAVQLKNGVAVQIVPGDQESVSVSGQAKQAEHYVVTYTGPGSARTFHLWLSPDAARAPVRIQAPFSLAVFTAELQ